MISKLLQRARRKACQQLVVELFQFNTRDDCWDPIGSIDREGLRKVVEFAATDKLPEKYWKGARRYFEKVKR